MKNILSLLVYAGFLLATELSAVNTTPVLPTTSNNVALSSAPEEMTMLSSPAELKLYALSQVASGSSYIWGESILISSDDVRYIYVQGDVDKVIEKMMFDPASQFRFNVRNTDQLFVYSSLSNTEGESLFTGYTYVTPESVSGGLNIYPKVLFQMIQSIPIRFEGATYARVHYTDPATGESWTESLSVVNGKIYFPVQYAGRGTLVVGRGYPSNYTPGYEIELAYNLQNGLRIQSQQVTEQFEYVEIENYKYTNDLYMPQSGPLIDSTYMALPSKDGWSVVSPPTGAIKLEQTPVGTSRQFQVNISFVCTAAELGNIEAFIYDPDTVDSQGYVNEFPGIVSINSSVDTAGRTVTTVTVNWIVRNNGIKAGTSKWLWRFESTGFNEQSKPQRPWYGGQG